jgi:hypothetical protein
MILIMKGNRKSLTLVSFILGTVIFVTTAFADVMLGSGYDNLKDSMKRTTKQMESGFDNFTFESRYEINGYSVAKVHAFRKLGALLSDKTEHKYPERVQIAI